MLKLKRKTYFFFVIFLSIFTFLIYLFLYENNPVNNYYNNFSNTFFKLEKLKLDGRVRSNKTKILSSLSLELNSPILKINLEKIKKNILSVPWIKSAKVSRKLPNEIHIFIEEYEPAAIWENKNEVLILDKDGYHIEKIQKKDAYDDLLFVYGNEADLNKSNFLNALDDYPSLKSRIDYATFNEKEDGIYI
jgi:Cell division septal protein